MKDLISTCVIFFLLFQSSIAQEISLNGTVWLESDLNGTYEGENGINGLKIYLINSESNEIIDSAITMNYEYNFPSTDFNVIPPGSYYLQFAIEEFDYGGGLYGLYSCIGSYAANDFVDSDDNGSDFLPTQTTVFGLDTGIGTVTYIDFCFYSDCNEEPVWAFESCDQISEQDVFCGISALNNLCGLMPTTDSPGSQPVPLCPSGGVPNNISWFTFIADAGIYSITVTPTGCFGSMYGQEGIQMGIYTDCTFTNAVYCVPDCSTNPVTFDSSYFIPGQTYYFFIDGCTGSTCSYEIQITGTPIPYSLDVDQLCMLNEGNQVCEDSGFCVNEEITFQTSNQNVDAEYTWVITTISGDPYQGNPSPITEENNIDLIFEDIGVYSVCLTSINNSCTEWQGNKCRTVTIEDAIDEVFNDISVCEDMISDFDVALLNDQDPNGDGIFGWIDTDFEFTFGDNISIVNDSFICPSEQQILITPIANLELSLIPNADLLCVGDTLNLMLDTNGSYDSLTWSINGIIQSDPFGVLIPEVGEQNIVATISNACGTVSDEVTIQVLGSVNEVFDTIRVCEDLISDFDVTSLNDQDPNGDGIFGWIVTDFEFTFGNNVSTVSDSNLCTYEQQIFIEQDNNLEISLTQSADSLCVGDTLNFTLDTDGGYDSLTWSVNGIIQSDAFGILIPEVGQQNIEVTISNVCGSVSDEAIIQVLDTISAPSVSCDTSTIGSVTFFWPTVDDVEGYWLKINGESTSIVTDTFFEIDNLGYGEEVDIEFNIIDPNKCVGPSAFFTCAAPYVVNVIEYSEDDINIIPNPTYDYLNIDGMFVFSDASYRIFSIDGELIKSGILNDTRRIDVMNLSSGLYLIAIDQNDNGKKWVKRFVKQ